MPEPAGQDPNTPPAGGDPTGGQDPAAPKTFDEAYVKKLREEAAGHRTRANEAEAKLKKIDDDKLEETDRLKKAADEANQKVTAAEERARKALARAETLTAAAKAKIIDPDAAFQLIQGKIEFDDEGSPKNVDALLTQLVKDKPYLLGSGDAGGGDGANPANPGSGNRGGALSLEAIKKMSSEQINAQWDKVQLALKAGK